MMNSSISAYNRDKRNHPYARHDNRGSNGNDVKFEIDPLVSFTPKSKVINNNIITPGNQPNAHVDTGMQLLVGNVEQVAHWCRLLSFLEPTKIIYQVFGIMDSVITGSHKCEKIFCLRNTQFKNSTIVCVFYEIDRKFPSIPKGTLVLCTGHVKGKNKLQIFTIRELHKNDKNAFGKISSYSQQIINDIIKFKKV